MYCLNCQEETDSVNEKNTKKGIKSRCADCGAKKFDVLPHIHDEPKFFHPPPPMERPHHMPHWAKVDIPPHIWNLLTEEEKIDLHDKILNRMTNKN